MNKLEELGGLKAVKAEAKERDRIPDGQMLHALIEHIESLTSEREALKKRVETSIQMLSEDLAVNTALQRMTSNLESQLQASQKRVEELEHSWKCFRCGELFTEYEKAAEHFNGDFCEDEEPWCQFVERMEAAERRVEELEAKRRVIMCIWCGSSITPTDDHKKTISNCQAHDKMCEANPMVAQLQAARELAEMVDTFVPYAPGTTLRVFDEDRLRPMKAMAREFLKL